MSRLPKYVTTVLRKKSKVGLCVFESFVRCYSFIALRVKNDPWPSETSNQPKVMIFYSQMLSGIVDACSIMPFDSVYCGELELPSL